MFDTFSKDAKIVIGKIVPLKIKEKRKEGTIEASSIFVTGQKLEKMKF